MLDLTKLKVLIVDDVHTVRQVMTKMLNKLLICNITEASSVAEAWGELQNGYIKGEGFDLILCDWNMPDSDGIELLKLVRSNPCDKFRLTKFVMVTGGNSKVKEAIDTGANSVIHKPFCEMRLTKKLEIIYSLPLLNKISV